MLKHSLLAGIALAAALTGPAAARVVGLTIATVNSPAFGGRSFGTVGQYEELIGTVTGEIDPLDPRNALIADIALAPRTPRGTVAYATPLFILRPIDPSAGRHALLFEPPNNGNKTIIAALDSFGAADETISDPNTPTSSGDAGDGWLMRQGYTLAWAGWQVLAAPASDQMSISLPLARGPGGRPVTGRALAEISAASPGLTRFGLPFAAAASDPAAASLTMRKLYADVPLPVIGWTAPSASSVGLPAGQTLAPGWLYEFAYTATGSPVSGLGFAAVRDVAAFLRHGAPAVASPLGTDIATAFGVGFSQSGRFLRDFVCLGFNRSEAGEPVFDGLDIHAAGGNGVFLNARFAVPAETERQHTSRWYPEGRFPFAWATTIDPMTGVSGGALLRCTATATCPKIIQSLSANEYWEKAASLLTTDPAGTADLPDAPGVRSYLFASLPHSAGAGPGLCAQPQNPLNGRAGLRALMAALDSWVRLGTAPPPSQVPLLATRTLAPPGHRPSVHFPAIPGVAYAHVATIRNLRDWGADFTADGGVVTRFPPVMIGTKSPARTSGPGIYPSYVPTTDADGNDAAGIRLPDIAVPVATFTGWALAGPGQATGDGCGPSGQMIAFPPNPAAARAAGDPREDLASRYPSHAAYVAAITRAANDLLARRFLLAEDVATYVALANASSVGTGAATPPQPLGQ